MLVGTFLNYFVFAILPKRLEINFLDDSSVSKRKNPFSKLIRSFLHRSFIYLDIERCSKQHSFNYDKFYSLSRIYSLKIILETPDLLA